MGYKNALPMHTEEPNQKPSEWIYLTKYHLSTMAGQTQVSSESLKPSCFRECWRTPSGDRQNGFGQERSEVK